LDLISLSSSSNEKYFGQKVVEKIKTNILCSKNPTPPLPPKIVPFIIIYNIIIIIIIIIIYLTANGLSPVGSGYYART